MFRQLLRKMSKENRTCGWGVRDLFAREFKGKPQMILELPIVTRSTI